MANEEIISKDRAKKSDAVPIHPRAWRPQRISERITPLTCSGAPRRTCETFIDGIERFNLTLGHIGRNILTTGSAQTAVRDKLSGLPDLVPLDVGMLRLRPKIEACRWGKIREM